MIRPAPIAGSVWQHSAVNVVTPLAFEIPGANPLDVEVALEVLLRGDLVRIVPSPESTTPRRSR